MASTGRVSINALVWTTLFLLIGGGIWWVVHNAPSEKIDPGQLTSDRTPAKPVATIDESLGATDISIKGLDLTVKGTDGKMSMQVVAEQATKLRSLYSIREGSLQFFIDEKNTVVIGLNNASYSREAGIVRVKGTLIGRIAQGGQYFKAEELSWDESQMQIGTKEVRYVGPNLEVSGKQMSIDMKTAEVTFHGPVEVGI